MLPPEEDIALFRFGTNEDQDAKRVEELPPKPKKAIKN